MKIKGKLILILLFILASFSYAQLDTTYWKFYHPNMQGQIVNLTNKTSYMGNSPYTLHPSLVYNINNSEQISIPVVLYFDLDGSLNAHPTSPVSVGDTSILLNNVTGLAIGNKLEVYKDSLLNRWYVGTVMNIIGNRVIVDAPFDFAYPTTSYVINSSINLNVDGSTSLKSFKIHTFPLAGNDWFDITRIMISITTNTQPDMGKFGDLTALRRGIVVRYSTGGKLINLFTIKKNADLALIAFETSFYDNSKAGVYGVSSILTFSGKDKMGSALRITPGDYLEILIQDNLTGLTSFNIIAEGHIIN